jgi:hypothetical protein
MTILMRRIFGLTVVALSAGSLVAQAGQLAVFHLPFAAQWGPITLAPGDYRIAVPEIAMSSPQFLVSGKDARGFILPTSTDIEASRLKPSSRSYLQLVKVDGTFFVAKYQSGVTGAAFTFKVPHSAHAVEMARRDVIEVNASGR